MTNLNAYLDWIQDPLNSANIGGYSVEVRINARLPNYWDFPQEQMEKVEAALDLRGWSNSLACNVTRREIPVQAYIQQLIHRLGYLTENRVFDKRATEGVPIQHLGFLADAMNSTGICYRAWSKYITVVNWPICLDFEG